MKMEATIIDDQSIIGRQNLQRHRKQPLKQQHHQQQLEQQQGEYTFDKNIERINHSTQSKDIKDKSKTIESALVANKHKNTNCDQHIENKSINVCLSRKLINANWHNFIVSSNQQYNFTTETATGHLMKTPSRRSTNKKPSSLIGIQPVITSPTKHIAMDCEMVGVGYMGKRNMLARVSLVNKYGAVLLDKYVKPREPVVDYRTRVSGIRRCDLAIGDDFQHVRQQVADLLENRILIGHAVYNDLKVLLLKHPNCHIRDTSKYKPLLKMVNLSGATPSLKMLTRCVLGDSIQQGEHNSIEDAQATMSIYNQFSHDWETTIRQKNRNHHNHQQHNHQE